MCGCLSRTPHGGTWPTTQACAPTGNRTSDPLVCRPGLNPLSHTSQGVTRICQVKRERINRKVKGYVILVGSLELSGFYFWQLSDEPWRHSPSFQLEHFLTRAAPLNGAPVRRCLALSDLTEVKDSLLPEEKGVLIFFN